MVSESGPAGCVRRAGALQLSITVDFPLSMEPELFDGDSALVDHSRCDPVEGALTGAAMSAPETLRPTG